MANNKRLAIKPDLLAQKPSVNLAAVPTPGVEAERPVPTEVKSTPEPIPEPAPAAAAPPQVAPAAPVPAAAVQEQAVTTQQPVVITAPVHARHSSTKDSQMSFMVEPDRYERVQLAKVKTRLTGREILSEALDIWLAHNGF